MRSLSNLHAPLCRNPPGRNSDRRAPCGRGAASLDWRRPSLAGARLLAHHSAISGQYQPGTIRMRCRALAYFAFSARSCLPGGAGLHRARRTSHQPASGSPPSCSCFRNVSPRPPSPADLSPRLVPTSLISRSRATKANGATSPNSKLKFSTRQNSPALSPGNFFSTKAFSAPPAPATKSASAFLLIGVRRVTALGRRQANQGAMRFIFPRALNEYTPQLPQRRITPSNIQKHKSAPEFQWIDLAAIDAAICLPTVKRTILKPQCSAIPGNSEPAQ